MTAIEVTKYFADFCSVQRITLTDRELTYALQLIDDDPEHWEQANCWDLLTITRRDS